MCVGIHEPFDNSKRQKFLERLSRSAWKSSNFSSRSLFPLFSLSFGVCLARCVTIFAYYSHIATNPFQMKDVGNCVASREKRKIIRTLHNKIKFPSLCFMVAFFSVSIILSRKNFFENIFQNLNTVFTFYWRHPSRGARLGRNSKEKCGITVDFKQNENGKMVWNTEKAKELDKKPKNFGDLTWTSR